MADNTTTIVIQFGHFNKQTLYIGQNNTENSCGSKNKRRTSTDWHNHNVVQEERGTDWTGKI